MPGTTISGPIGENQSLSQKRHSSEVYSVLNFSLKEIFILGKNLLVARG